VIEEKLKIIHAQIRFGRAIEATQALEVLIGNATAKDLQLLLPPYIEVLMKRQRFDEAISAIERALHIGASDDAPELRGKLQQCQSEQRRTSQAANYEEVRFKHFIESIPRIFQFGATSSTGSTFIEIPTTEAATRFAHDQNVEAPYYPWNAARTSAAREVRSYCYSKSIDLSHFNSYFCPAIEKMCGEHLSSSTMWFFDDVCGDLIEIARGLLVGVTPPLHRLMNSAYERHLFPCGWIGGYPSGQLLVHRLWY
jgi:hypothetical protein